MKRVLLWHNADGTPEYAEADTLQALALDPRVQREPSASITVGRWLREEAERLEKWVCTPETRVYGPGCTRIEAEARHAKFLRSGYSRSGSDAYHRVESMMVSR